MPIMDDWEKHENVEYLKTHLNVPGRGLGKVSPRIFESATWAWCIDTLEGQCQYGKFVEAMMNRIRFEESNPTEIKSFVDLMAADENGKFLRAAQPHIPELGEAYVHPNDHKNFQLSLLYQQLKKLVHERTKRFRDIQTTSVTDYSNGLSKAEKVFLEQLLFDCYTGSSKRPETPAMRRLLDSTLELGFPQKALDRKLAEAKAYGTDIERDTEGLPGYLLIPGEVRGRRIWHERLAAIGARATCIDTVEDDGLSSAALTDIDDARKSHDGQEDIVQLQVNDFTRLQFLFEVMPELAEQQVANRKSDLSRNAHSPGLEYLCQLPVIAPRTAPQEGPIYPRGMDPHVAPSQPESQPSNEAPSSPGSPSKPNITASEATGSDATTDKGSSLSSSDSKAVHAVAKSAPQLTRPRRRKRMQGVSPMVVLKENGALVTYLSPARRGQ